MDSVKVIALKKLQQYELQTPQWYESLNQLEHSKSNSFFIRGNKSIGHSSINISRKELIDNSNHFFNLLENGSVMSIEDSISPIFSGATLIYDGVIYTETVIGLPSNLLRSGKVDLKHVLYSGESSKAINLRLEQSLFQIIVTQLNLETKRLHILNLEKPCLVEWTYDKIAEGFLYFDYKESVNLGKIPFEKCFSENRDLKKKYTELAVLSHIETENYYERN